MSGYPIRPIEPDEWPAYWGVLDEAFNNAWPDEARDDFKENVEFDRTLVAFDGHLPVGGTTVHSFQMTVPGGPRPVAGVTAVAVLPSHRREGILTDLMTRQLNDLHEDGEAVAALYASEGAIYGRYGYGRAADNMFFRISKASSAFVRHAPFDPTVRLRVANPVASQAELAKIFDAVLPTRPGLYARTPGRWKSVVEFPEYRREGAGPLRCVIAEDSVGLRGYALFAVKASYTDHDVPDGDLRLFELFAVDPGAYTALWRHVLDRDLIGRVHAWNRPADDPIINLLADQRQLSAGWSDELWIRVVDIERGLVQRSYAAPVDVVVELSDEFCPWNAGRWRLSADRSGAACTATSDPPDIALRADVLGSLYLGGQSLAGFAGAGMIQELRPGSVGALSTAFSWDPKPWCGLVF